MDHALQKPPPFLIRQAVAADCDGILECLRSAFEPFRSQYTSDAYLDTVLDRESLTRRLCEMVLLVAVSDTDDAIGTIACTMVDREEGHLRGMAVVSAWQGHGVAEKLLERAEFELRKSGCERITLDTTTPLKRAVRFYERNGFRATGRVTDFFGMPLFEYAKKL